VGDVVVCGQAYGRIKSMHDTLNPRIRYEEALPSMPVNLWGLDVAPGAGEHFYVLDDIGLARDIAESRAQRARAATLAGGDSDHVTLENLFERLEGAGDVQTLNIILRADTRGSIEAIRKELGKLEHPEVKVKVLQATVGGVTEADVTLADASDAIIIGFNVVPDEKARAAAEQRGVQIRRYDVIYKITDELRLALEGMLKPEEREVDLGRALVQQVFRISRVGAVAGCRVLAGTVERNGRARVIRDSTVIGDYAIDTLKREKDDAKEVREGLECGIKLTGFNDVKEGDLLEVYRVEEVGRTFDR
jgi:translation initiation factor IF-2